MHIRTCASAFTTTHYSNALALHPHLRLLAWFLARLIMTYFEGEELVKSVEVGAQARVHSEHLEELAPDARWMGRAGQGKRARRWME